MATATTARPIAAPAPAAPAAPRGGSGTARPAARRSRSRSRRSARPARRFRPAGGNSACAGCRPEIASTVCCNSVSVNSAGISSNTTGRYFSLARSRAIAVARIRRWSKRIGSPSGGSLARGTRGLAAVARRLLDQPRLVEQLVAVEHLLLVPGRAADAEAEPQPLAPAERRGRLAMPRRGPLLEQRHDDLVEDRGPPLAPVLPRKEAVPRLEPGAAASRSAAALSGHAREREIADRDHVHAGVVRPRVAAAVAEGVELLDIADAIAVCAATQARRPISKVRCASGSNGPNGRPARGSPFGIGGDQDARLARPPRRRWPRSARFRSASEASAWDRSMRRSWIIPDRAGRDRLAATACRGRCASTAAIMRPSRPSMRSAMADEHDVRHRGRRGVRGSRARWSSRRGRGLSAQAEMKAPAVERLMPA